MALLGLHERILELLEYGDIAFWPAAADFKYEDLRDYDEDELDITFFNGGIKTEENEEIANLLREKSKIMVAFGSCAHLGGLPGLANMSDNEEVFDTVYRENPTTNNRDRVVPEKSSNEEGQELKLPGIHERVQELSRVVDVDYTIPGCPPPPNLTGEFLDLLIEDNLPEKGSVVAGEKTVCDECVREWNQETIGELRRPNEVDIDTERCLLDQGVICLGPATRSGCGGSCPAANQPCRGCFGPPPEVQDQGAEMMNSLASILQIGEEGQGLDQERNLLGRIPDPIGTFYPFSLPVSIFGGKVYDGSTDERK